LDAAINNYQGDFYERAKRLGSSGNTIGIGSAEMSGFVGKLNITIQNQADNAAARTSTSCAGEHGRGFAVVADGVRELANKTLRRPATLLSEIGVETVTAVNIMEN
jgi:methyl-accepting chemotaxis protein